MDWLEDHHHFYLIIARPASDEPFYEVVQLSQLFLCASSLAKTRNLSSKAPANEGRFLYTHREFSFADNAD